MNINIYTLSNRNLAPCSFVFDWVFDDKSCWALRAFLFLFSKAVFCKHNLGVVIFYRCVLSSNRCISNAFVTGCIAKIRHRLCD